MALQTKAEMHTQADCWAEEQCVGRQRDRQTDRLGDRQTGTLSLSLSLSLSSPPSLSLSLSLSLPLTNTPTQRRDNLVRKKADGTMAVGRRIYRWW